MPLSGVRKVVAERMTLSAKTIPMVTLNSELDVTALVNYREALKKAGKDKSEIPGYNAIIAFLSAKALKEFSIPERVIYRQGNSLDGCC